MKKFIVLFIALGMFISTKSYSVDYDNGIGFRGGLFSGITFKHFLSPDNAIEVIGSNSFFYGSFRLTGLYEIHKGAFTQDVSGFFWFYGGGAHVGSIRGGYGGYYSSAAVFGIDGIFGLEYKIQELPITLGVDINPYLEFNSLGGITPYFFDGAFSIRYVF